ncbi:MAG: GNAT family N-acetyltransferase [Dokdonella sp.]|uniref:GNAT family N-acetyltransferase n=1 Tax=Dokdonella sp. TaxID=2291710 RepID=UPI0025B7C8C3|nr:GNAT family N-acetyltransferase [Dokdonella sp.]MBZ0224317.1 GNAT family N-acetyltransferase [Dokdonella sp.]MCC7254928.1 GNAT family N-acetyltransferase [Dokdonella sp.]
MNAPEEKACRLRAQGLTCAAVAVPLRKPSEPSATRASPLVRRAVPADLAALVELENASFSGDRLSLRQWRHHLDNPGAWILVAAQDGHAAGAAVVFFRSGSRVARLYSIAVAASLRGRGLGAELLESVERIARRRHCDRLRLEVRADNPQAQRLYERHGYQRIAHIEGYYEDGADAWRYEKRLA